MNFEKLQQYQLIKHNRIENINSEAYLVKHIKTGAKLVLLSNDDDNKVFNIGFRTPVSDNTGVPHIIEHSVLCGSEKFPVKDPFIELVKGSLNTFLNAMTYPDKTVYPVASCNDKDFQNLMDVYLDAVFNPDIYNHEEIFKQEGWHYELESKDDELKYNGVVYNEMKGAFSSVDGVLERQIMHSLYPDTTYGFESGGDPKEIPQLTYEQFLNFHSTYYHPSNSYIYLYGDMDMEEKLIWLDKEYLSKYDKLNVDSEIQFQQSFDEMKVTEQYMPISDSESEEENTILAYNVVVGSSLDKELYMAFQILDYALMNMPGAPLKQAIIDAGIGKYVYSIYENGILQPFYSVITKFAEADQKDEFLDVINKTLTEIAQKGIDKKSLEAAINNMEFKYREYDTGRFPKGLMIGLQLMDSWLYDENEPFMHIDADSTFAYMREQLNTDYFENLVKEYLLNSEISTLVILKPKKGLVLEEEKQLAEVLEDKKASLTDKAIEKLIKDTENLKIYQETPSAKEDVEKIPTLELADLTTEPRPIKNIVKEIDGVPVIQHDHFTNSIGYVNLSFDCKKLPAELLPYIGLVKATVGYMNTEKYSYTELANEINMHIGGMEVTAASYTNSVEKDKYKMQVEVGFKTLFSNMEKAFELAEEIMLTTDFHDYKRLKEILDELKSKVSALIMKSGDSIAAIRAMSYYSEVSYVKDQYLGIAFYKFIENIVKNFDDMKEEVAEKLGLAVQYIFRKENLTISYTCHGEDYEYLPEHAKAMLPKLYSGEIDSSILKSSETLKYVPQKKNEGFKTSSQVQYVVRTGEFASAGYEYTGTLHVLKTIMSYEYLWNNIRVQGGAYGCSNSYLRSGNVMFSSYRDPKLKETEEVYEKASEFVRNFDADERDMLKYIIGTISTLDVPKTPMDAGDRDFAMYMTDTTYDIIKKERMEVLNTNVNAVRKCADLIDAAMAQNNLCVIGNEGKIEQNAEMFGETVSIFE